MVNAFAELSPQQPRSQEGPGEAGRRVNKRLTYLDHKWPGLASTSL